jgi:hypothetical protein
MYVLSEQVIITGDIAAVWEVATDVPRWPEWDPHELQSRIDGPFEAGTTGWVKPKGAPAGGFTITRVDPQRAWGSEAGIPFGKLLGETRFEQLENGRIRVSKRMEVHGPFAPIFRLIWERGVRRDMQLTFAALERRAGHG